ncbi:GH-E family nuclease [Pluralibacter gergoviae]|uniref:GH-E family nuclease n=1 Tax=Pluralibacter gergoviae TaxID=61647 RepID=UPI001E5C24A0|nr:GH-E family nuclease [Pluralibacter gergoviae]
MDPLGLAGCRIKYMGRTPNKRSRTGKAVIERMRKEKRIIGSGDNMRFKSSTDGKWYPVKMADMAHLQDAVSYWNQRGGFFGAKASEVRAWMKDPNNYELEYFSHNRSQGAKLLENYKDPTAFIGPTEMPKYTLRNE